MNILIEYLFNQSLLCSESLVYCHCMRPLCHLPFVDLSYLPPNDNMYICSVVCVGLVGRSTPLSSASTHPLLLSLSFWKYCLYTEGEMQQNSSNCSKTVNGAFQVICNGRSSFNPQWSSLIFCCSSKIFLKLRQSRKWRISVNSWRIYLVRSRIVITHPMLSICTLISEN